ncbi:hypothetical protein JCM33374_g2274 [Metschnikowia sp. JCM 33374]|nr:hypothetical protein JCM33374_g2274 [Metschnikowia sp. JCM 33374]
MTFDPLLFAKFTKWVVKEIEPGFVRVSYNNPKTLNAYAEEDWRAYHQILTILDSDADTNVILISSSFARAFSSGLNLKAALGLLDGDNKTEEMSFAQKKTKMYSHIREFQDAIAMPARMRTPTIALLNGINYGLALDIASACTIRVATQDAQFSIREIKIGLVADMGSLQRITRLVGNRSLVNQYALTGEVFGAQEALSVGFVSKVVEDFDSGIDYCVAMGQDINSNPSWAIKGTKDSIQYIVDGGTHEQGLLNIAQYNAVHLVGGLPKMPAGRKKGKL